MTTLGDILGTDWVLNSVSSTSGAGATGTVKLVDGALSDWGTMVDTAIAIPWNGSRIRANVVVYGGADSMDIGFLDSADATTPTYAGNTAPFTGTTGFWGVRLDTYQNYICPMVNGVEGAHVAYNPRTAGLTSFEEYAVQFDDTGGGTCTVSLYRGGVLVQSWTALTAPSYASGHVAIAARDGGVAGNFYVENYVVVDTAAAPTEAPVVTGYDGNTANLLTWLPVARAATYDVFDGTTTVNTADTAFLQTGLTNGVAKTYTVTAKNLNGSGPASAGVTLTPNATPTLLLYDTFNRTATPPGNPDYGPIPSVQTNTATNGSALVASAANAVQIWDVGVTSPIQIDATLAAVATNEFDVIDSYTDANNYEFFYFNDNGGDGTYYTDVATVFTNLQGRNCKVYDVTQTGFLRYLRAGDLISVVVDAAGVRLLYNGVPQFAFPWKRVSTSKVGFRWPSGAGWAVTRVVAFKPPDTATGYVYKGRATKTLDTGSVA